MIFDPTRPGSPDFQIPELGEIRRQYAAHQAKRPTPNPGGAEWVAWCDEKRRLAFWLQLAEARDAGQHDHSEPVRPSAGRPAHLVAELVEKYNRDLEALKANAGVWPSRTWITKRQSLYNLKKRIAQAAQDVAAGLELPKGGKSR